MRWLVSGRMSRAEIPSMEELALTTLAGQTVVAAAVTNAWEVTRRQFAQLMGHGDSKKTQLAERRLDATREQVIAAKGTDLEKIHAALAAQWAARLADLLEEDLAAEADLRALVEAIQAALPVGTVPAADHTIAARKAKLFISYSHRDDRYREQLATHLASLRRRGVIAEWHDRKITPGEEWRRAIDQSLDAADCVLLLVTPHFLASDYCYSTEMQRTLEKHREGRVLVIPVIVRPTDWRGTPLGDLEALPKDAKPVVEWRPIDRAWLDVTEGIRRALAANAESVARLADQKSPVRRLITLYDSRSGGFNLPDFETALWEPAAGELSLASSEEVRDGILVIVRHNTGGTFVAWLNKYGYIDGPAVIPVGDPAGAKRRFQVRCQVRAREAEHTFLLTFKMAGAPMGEYLGQQHHRIMPGVWTDIDDHFDQSFSANCQLRLEDRSVSVAPSRLEIRNFVLTEYEPPFKLVPLAT